MTQPTHDEVIAWLKVELTYCDDILEFGADTLESNFKNMVSHYRASLLANRAVLERHKPIEHCKNRNCTGPVCSECGSKETVQIGFPCPTYTYIADPIRSVM